MKNIIQRIKVLFKIARLISSDDSGDFQQGVFGYMGSTPKGQIFIPYGVIGRPPDGSQMAVFAQNGNESNAIGFASDPKNRPVKDTLPGEHGIANYITGHYILFKNDGVTDLVTDELNIKTGDVQVVINTNGMAITGGAVTHNGTTIDDTHVHSQGSDSDGDSEVNTDPPV